MFTLCGKENAFSPGGWGSCTVLLHTRHTILVLLQMHVAANVIKSNAKGSFSAENTCNNLQFTSFSPVKILRSFQ